MTKRERLEDMGILYEKLRTMLDRDIFVYTSSKHDFENWKKLNYDKIEYDEPRGLDYIFRTIRGLLEDIDECVGLARGDDD